MLEDCGVKSILEIAAGTTVIEVALTALPPDALTWYTPVETELK